MNLGRCSHSIKGKGAGAKSKSKGSKVTAENSAVAPEGGEGCDIDPWVGIPAQDTANTPHPLPETFRYLHSGQVSKCTRSLLGPGQGKVMLSQGHNVLPNSQGPFWMCPLKGFVHPPQGFCKEITRNVSSCFTCCPAVPPKLQWDSLEVYPCQAALKDSWISARVNVLDEKTIAKPTW